VGVPTWGVHGLGELGQLEHLRRLLHRSGTPLFGPVMLMFALMFGLATPSSCGCTFCCLSLRLAWVPCTSQRRRGKSDSLPPLEGRSVLLRRSGRQALFLNDATTCTGDQTATMFAATALRRSGIFRLFSDFRVDKILGANVGVLVPAVDSVFVTLNQTSFWNMVFFASFRISGPPPTQPLVCPAGFDSRPERAISESGRSVLGLVHMGRSACHLAQQGILTQACHRRRRSSGSKIRSLATRFLPVAAPSDMTFSRCSLMEYRSESLQLSCNILWLRCCVVFLGSPSP
jgi:hypothetical protein